jgi:aminoglycoside phosphotransferase family enzyme/predicted kinase
VIDEALERSARMIEGLRQPRAYDHPVQEPVRVAETHISWVLLTGDFAYKVKKPLHLSFLDYSTAAAREHFCAEEVRLNRRHAPDLYLGVARITGPLDAPRIEGAGPTIDHAVRMRQFAPQDELAALIARGTLPAEALESLGEAVGRFHAGAAPAPPGSTFGDPATVRRVIDDNFAELGRLTELDDRRAAVSGLEQGLMDMLESRRPLLRARRDLGWVRECHGDLHCGNVVRWHGRLTPFDGIEFDPALRHIDVVNDVAFLTMDLAERGFPAFRHAVLQAWLTTLGDWAGLPLLPCYEAYRALVRAKVGAVRALQSGREATRRLAVADCRRYLDWARDRLGDRPGVLAVTCGLSGSGKTWLAHRICRELRWLHVRSDVERKRLAGLDPLQDSRSAIDAGIYTPGFHARTYSRLFDCADAALRGDESIVVDAAFLRRDERARFRELARTHGARFMILHCTAPAAVLRERVAARRARADDASEAGLEVLERQPAYWETFDSGEESLVLEIETGVPSAEAAALPMIRERIGG